MRSLRQCLEACRAKHTGGPSTRTGIAEMLERSESSPQAIAAGSGTLLSVPWLPKALLPLETGKWSPRSLELPPSSRWGYPDRRFSPTPRNE